jgi:hypothetical protein
MDEHCADYGSIDECSRKQMNKLKINADVIQTKVNDEIARGTPVLEELAINREKSGVMFYPDVIINKIPYLGQLEGIEVF